MGKKPRKHQSQAPQAFTNNPFKTLKGLPVSGEQEPVVSGKAVDEQQRQSTEDARQTFAEEMARLGVQSIGVADKRGTQAAPPDNGLDGSGEEPGRQEFLAAIGRLDRTFRDDWPEQEPPRHAQPRRLKQLQRGQLQPEAELDLHGMTSAEALHRTRCFLDNARHHGMRTVLVITGKGGHSEGGPVLKLAVAELLDRLADVILEWGEAPGRYGGSGALVVFLRRQAGGDSGQ